MQVWLRSFGLLAATAVAISSTSLVPGLANAKDDQSAVSAHIVVAKDKEARTKTLTVYSAAMQRDISVDVILPADDSAPRPTLYMLDGDYRRVVTDMKEFLADKNVNVVIPIGGENAYWTDWREADPVLGVNKWTTFLTTELPPLIDSTFHTTGRNAIAGMSRTGTAALQLAVAAPGLYKAVGTYSGCAQIADPLGHGVIELTMEQYGGGDPANMYGPAGDPMWAANDPYVHADKLKDTALYISNGTGVPGSWERLDAPEVEGRVDKLARQVAVGGTIEAISNYCTHQFADKLNSLKIPATYNFRAIGTHSWGYWQEDFKDSWPVLAHGLGL